MLTKSPFFCVVYDVSGGSCPRLASTFFSTKLHRCLFDASAVWSDVSGAFQLSFSHSSLDLVTKRLLREFNTGCA
jgi:hypothetical protein